MLTLHFCPLAGPFLAVGPFPALRLAGTSLRAEPHDLELAVHQNGMWCRGGLAYVAVLVPTPCTVQFETAAGTVARAYGPFPDVTLIGYSLRYGPNADLLAQLKAPSREWYDCLTGTRHPVMVVQSV